MINTQGLAKALEDDDNAVYVINVNNQYTALLPDNGVNPLVNESTPDIISCDESRVFWVSWQDRMIGRL